jgi:hypothetical protein
MFYVGKVAFLLCASYGKYTRSSSLCGWVGGVVYRLGMGTREVILWEQQGILHLHAD